MFERTLQEKLERIFRMGKVTFDKVSESHEQEGVFVEISKSWNSIKDGLEIARVTGKIRIFGNSSKMPFGFISKALAGAAPADTKALYFFDFEENAGQNVNIVERSASFVYLYSNQYDPAIGEITSVELSIAET